MVMGTLVTPRGWRALALRLGRTRAILATCVVAVLMSLLITALTNMLLGKPTMPLADLLSTIIVPLLVTPMIGYLAFSLLFETHHARLQLHQAAIRDDLTGLYNRRHAMLKLDAEIASAHADNRPLALLMVDVDHFKSINDQLGHPVGDQVIVLFAHVLARSVRPWDTVARFGGEEFIVLMPDTDLEQALAGAERLRAVIQSARGPREAMQDRRPVTASFGVTTLGADGEDATALLARVDRALYAAKQRGRNRSEALAP